MREGKNKLKSLLFAKAREGKAPSEEGIEHFCPNCGATLDEQEGFDPSKGDWTCTKCGQPLYGEVYDGERFPGTMWYCDKCGALLNKQAGFRDVFDEWVCTACGYCEKFEMIVDTAKRCPTLKKNAVKVWRKAKPYVKKTAKVAAGVGLVVGAVVVAYALLGAKKDGATEAQTGYDAGEALTTKYKIIFDGEEQDEVFDTEKAADEYGLYLCSCSRLGAEILHMSNPGDYDYDEETFEESEYEIIEVE